jgi:hypothetical protein
MNDANDYDDDSYRWQLQMTATMTMTKMYTGGRGRLAAKGQLTVIIEGGRQAAV